MGHSQENWGTSPVPLAFLARHSRLSVLALEEDCSLLRCRWDTFLDPSALQASSLASLMEHSTEFPVPFQSWLANSMKITLFLGRPRICMWGTDFSFCKLKHKDVLCCTLHEVIHKSSSSTSCAPRYPQWSYQRPKSQDFCAYRD